jgi:surface antigen
MNRKYGTTRSFGRRATILAACIGITMMLSGCNAASGALLGGWFGAVAGGTTEAALTGALFGAGVGAIIGQEMDRDYGRREPRDWYQPCECTACGTSRYDY